MTAFGCVFNYLYILSVHIPSVHLLMQEQNLWILLQVINSIFGNHTQTISALMQKYSTVFPGNFTPVLFKAAYITIIEQIAERRHCWRILLIKAWSENKGYMSCPVYTVCPHCPFLFVHHFGDHALRTVCPLFRGPE